MEYYTYAQRRIGQWRVTLIGDHISIIGDRYSNYGVIYRHMVAKWEQDPVHTQIIGMDSERGITRQTLAYIHKYIRKYYA